MLPVAVARSWSDTYRLHGVTGDSRLERQRRRRRRSGMLWLWHLHQQHHNQQVRHTKQRHRILTDPRRPINTHINSILGITDQHPAIPWDRWLLTEGVRTFVLTPEQSPLDMFSQTSTSTFARYIRPGQTVEGKWPIRRWLIWGICFHGVTLPYLRYSCFKRTFLYCDFC